MSTIESAQLLYLWIAFTALAVIGISAILVWAVRSGQFGDQERARSLPLVSNVPIAAPTTRRPPGELATPCSSGGRRAVAAVTTFHKGQTHDAP